MTDRETRSACGLSNPNNSQEDEASNDTRLPTPPASRAVSLHHHKTSRPSLEDFVLLKSNPTGTGLVIWSFNEQQWVAWDPKKLEKARALLWHGVFMVLKALYFCHHSFPDGIVAKWAPHEYIHLVHGKEEWATKLKTTQSHFHSYVLQRALTYNVLKRWRAFKNYPKRQSSHKSEEELRLAKSTRARWFWIQAESNRETFLTFTHFTSDVIDWEHVLVHKRKSSNDQKVYTWIMKSMVSAAEIVFELEIDDQTEDDALNSRRGKSQRNEKWVQEGVSAPHDMLHLFPLTNIFGLDRCGNESKDAVTGGIKSPNGISIEKRLPESASDIAGSGDATHDSLEKRQKRKRQQTQKAREALEDSRKKRSTETRTVTAVPSPEPGADSFIARVLGKRVDNPEVQTKTPTTSPHLSTSATKVGISNPKSRLPYSRATSSAKRDQGLDKSLHPEPAFVLEGDEESGKTSDMANQDPVMTDVQKTSSPALPTIHSVEPLSSTKQDNYAPSANPSLTTENICLWDNRETMDFLERMQVSEDDVVTIGVHKWGCYDGPPDELGFDGISMLQLEREHIMDDNKTLKLEDPQRMWEVIRATQNFARRNDQIVAERQAARENGSSQNREAPESQNSGEKSDLPDSDPIVAPTSRNSRGKRPMYEVSDDEDVDDEKSVDMDLDPGDYPETALSDFDISEESDLYDE